jgi:hypothetical protein
VTGNADVEEVAVDLQPEEVQACLRPVALVGLHCCEGARVPVVTDDAVERGNDRRDRGDAFPQHAVRDGAWGGRFTDPGAMLTPRTAQRVHARVDRAGITVIAVRAGVAWLPAAFYALRDTAPFPADLYCAGIVIVRADDRDALVAEKIEVAAIKCAGVRVDAVRVCNALAAPCGVLAIPALASIERAWIAIIAQVRHVLAARRAGGLYAEIERACVSVLAVHVGNAFRRALSGVSAEDETASCWITVLDRATVIIIRA